MVSTNIEGHNRKELGLTVPSPPKVILYEVHKVKNHRIKTNISNYNIFHNAFNYNTAYRMQDHS